ncbi:head-tail connector protein [Sutcliffiella horikoshii]|uniref:head-tail connector protein n=1 Tax=Sutcliffiella horikoshii TaxID=79883 RepID=UPI003CF73BB4
MITLLEKVKANLILNHEEDNTLIEGYIAAAISYAESFQQLADGHYNEHSMSPATEQGIIMLATHFYESRDGSTGGFFGDNVRAAEQVWDTVHLLLRMGKEWKV